MVPFNLKVLAKVLHLLACSDFRENSLPEAKFVSWKQKLTLETKLGNVQIGETLEICSLVFLQLHFVESVNQWGTRFADYRD